MVRETAFSCVEAPVLKGVSIHQSVEFKRLRNLYEKHVDEKGKGLKEDIILASLWASIEEDDLNISIAAGWINAASLNKIAEKQIYQCIAQCCKRDTKGELLYLVDQTVNNVDMNTSIAEAADRVWPLRRKYHNVLRLASYGYIMQTRPHIAISDMLKKLKLPQLYRRMLEIISWRKNENSHNTIFDRIVWEVAVQVDMIQVAARGTHWSYQPANKEPTYRGKKTFHVAKKSKRTLDTTIIQAYKEWRN